MYIISIEILVILWLNASIITEFKSATTLVATDDDRSTIETCLFFVFFFCLV